MHRFDAQISVRLRHEEKQLLESVAQARGEAAADFLRRGMLKELATLGFLSDDEAKALGMKF